MFLWQRVHLTLNINGVVIDILVYVPSAISLNVNIIDILFYLSALLFIFWL